MTKRFEKMLDTATEQTLVEPHWEGILDCVDMIRASEVPVKDAIGLIQKRYHSTNPHVAHHALLVLEACVKNCGKKFHTEVATKEFMDDLKNLVIASAPEKVKEKVLELIQCWASAFRNKPEYKLVNDTHNLLKMNGFQFPTIKEADAMFMADAAPDWAEGDNCYRCRTEFGVFTRKHHCRACGQIFCLKCSNKQMLLPQFGIEKKVRVCEQCFDKRMSQKISGGAASSAQSASGTSNPASEEAKEKARLKELEDKENEDLELAMAISQSEAEAKEQERQNSIYRSYNGNSSSSSDKANSYAPLQSMEQVAYKGSGGNVVIEEMPSTRIENDNEPPLDPMLAKYLDRNYWERKREDKELDLQRATAPPPSEHGGSSAASQMAASHNIDYSTNQNGFDTVSLAATPSLGSVTTGLDKLTLQKQPSISGEEEDAGTETSQFCLALREQVDTMNNRMKSNSMRGRSIVNDSAIHSLFLQLTSHHANVLSRLTKLESDREYYESLQDHLAHIQEARQAVNALREEFQLQRQEQLKEEQYRRRQQMQQKLDFMRQKKHEMLLYQRHMALQRFQEQEQQIQQSRGASTYVPVPPPNNYSTSYRHSPVNNQHPQDLAGVYQYSNGAQLQQMQQAYVPVPPQKEYVAPAQSQHHQQQSYALAPQYTQAATASHPSSQQYLPSDQGYMAQGYGGGMHGYGQIGSGYAQLAQPYGHMSQHSVGQSYQPPQDFGGYNYGGGHVPQTMPFPPPQHQHYVQPQQPAPQMSAVPQQQVAEDLLISFD